MTIVLLMLLVILQILCYLEIRRFLELFRETIIKKQPKAPPKARSSFVVKRMEERLREALYE